MAFLERARQLIAASAGDQAPLVGILIVVAATAVVLAAGWLLALLTSVAF